MDPVALTAELRRAAESLGFTLTGACPAVTPPGLSRFEAWLEAGYAGDMTYLAERRSAYEHPCHVLPGARSLLMLGMTCPTAPRPSEAAGRGRIARYAAARVDYHEDIRARLKRRAGRRLSATGKLRKAILAALPFSLTGAWAS